RTRTDDADGVAVRRCLCDRIGTGHAALAAAVVDDHRLAREVRQSLARPPPARAMMSLGPPGGNGTISRIVRAGNSSAVASEGESNPINRTMRIRMHASLLWIEHDLFGKPVPTFPDHALKLSSEQLERRFVDSSITGRDDAAA